MRLDATVLKGQAVAFLAWWGRELRAMVPDRLAGKVARLFRILIVETDGRKLTFHMRRDGQDVFLFETDLDRAALAATGRTIGRSLANFAGSYDRLLLRLSPDMTLRRDLRLPLAARGSLEEAAGYDLDRQTPFTADKVWYGVRTIATDPRERILTARLHVVRRSDLEPILECLDAAGLVPDRIEAEANGPDLRPPHLRKPRFIEGRGGIAALLLLVLLGIFAARLPLGRLEAARAELAPEIAQARAQALAVEALRDGLERAREREEDLFRRKKNEPSTLDLLAELTAAFPDSAFLIEFSIERGDVTMSGYAKKASDLLSLVEALPDLEAARFLSPVTQEPRVGRERFSMIARIVPRDREREAQP